jgi:CDP-glycerol glycerophosphotransferase (TagB/SpsB family)
MDTIKIRRMIVESFLAVRQTLAAVRGWVLWYPLTWVVKRNSRLTMVLSRPGRVFADNSKYFFVCATELAREGDRVIMLTQNHDIQDLISDAGGEAVLHPSRRSYWLLLHCGTVVADMADWIDYGVYPLTCGARLVQIWHGAPLKHIELDVYKRRLKNISIWLRPFLKIQKAILGRYPVYDVVVATSQKFISDAFQRCFKARQFIATGYPRNDILFGWPEPRSMASRLSWINVDKPAMEMVTAYKSRGHTICLYVPTFRKDLDNPLESKLDLVRLSAFARQYHLLIVLKLHPSMHSQYGPSRYPNLLEYAPSKDVYPLMALSDLLITDYSSIFLDFLLLDRPILFFAYDLENYLSNDRNMYFDYDSMTPGAKCYSYEDLELQLKNVITNGCKDQYAEMRMKVRSYTHDYMDNKAARRLILQHLRNVKY